MTDESEPRPPDWLGAAQDCLKEKGLDEAAGWLSLTLEAVEILERFLGGWLAAGWLLGDIPRSDLVLALIARARGETPDETFGRLLPPQVTTRDMGGMASSGGGEWMPIGEWTVTSRPSADEELRTIGRETHGYRETLERLLRGGRVPPELAPELAREIHRGRSGPR